MSARRWIAKAVAAWVAAALLLAPLAVALAHSGIWGAPAAALLHAAADDHGHEHEEGAPAAHDVADHEHQSPALLPRGLAQTGPAAARRKPLRRARDGGDAADRPRRPPRTGTD